ncbi:ABC transporter ATP-binding protein/permease [Candidatus Pelagibacter bacterium]|nr:ABC transporter ATP-binding protein [Candidatus Pelagibacter bacterium]MDA8805010.1 ABC transporter ATP-binding protein/permease [Candidatus Pelagibacter bacterium]
MQILKKIIFFFNSKQKKQAFFLLILTFIMSLLDMLGVASIMPFIAVLGNPELIETNNVLNSAFQISMIIGVETKNDFLFTLGCFVFIMLVVSMSFKALLVYLQANFSHMCEFSIGKRLIETYLHQPYSWFLNRNSSELSKNILSEVEEVIGAGLNPIINIITQFLVIITLTTLLILVNPKLTIVVFFTLAISYIIIFSAIKKVVKKIGIERIDNNEFRFNAVTEAFGAFKELKVGRLEKVYIKRFSDPAYKFAKNKATMLVISQLPRFFLEIISFGGMVILVLYLLAKNNNFASSLPVIALYAFAGYRMMPALQLTYNSLSQLRFIKPAIDNLQRDLINLKKDENKNDNKILSFKKNIFFKNVCFSYPNSSSMALKNINISIAAQSTVGIVGTTGSGKTTMVDIILGLLDCQKGLFQVDDQIVGTNNIRSWQRSIGYVPQQIYLADDTISANIAFGVDPNDIDDKVVERVSKIAQLHNFVNKELPLKYQTTVGERGVRLSGGQRQRIGIARALYHNPQLLIMDEATSALDNLTEKDVMQAVHDNSLNITMIIVAHRISTVKDCDNIFILKNGEIQDQGTYDNLKINNDYFKATTQTF